LSLDTFSATPAGNGLSPILKAVSDCDISQDESLPFDLASFVTASALDDLDQVFEIAPILQVSERTVSMDRIPFRGLA
jgi:hypothetical protein